MNVVMFNGSPHPEGVIAAGFEIIKAELAAAGIGTDVIQVGGKPVRGCIDCGGCRKAPKGPPSGAAQGEKAAASPSGTRGLDGVGCVLKDDGPHAGFVNECRRKVEAADGVILGSPVYYGGIAGNYKCFLDRLFFQGTRLDYKPAAVVASLRRSGGIATYHQLGNYLTLAGAVIVPTCYWNVIHGNTPDELAEDMEAVSIMKVIGKNMAWLLRSLDAAKKTVPLPEHERRNWTNFIH
ncbi:MAG: flavodoxin family protein [Spirochaetaceae bacterium]|jgi:multimeric flavodoxin WrbA|nr:flavodoxin family protein [Spirochaetaceae bacterium]